MITEGDEIASNSRCIFLGEYIFIKPTYMTVRELIPMTHKHTTQENTCTSGMLQAKDNTVKPTGDFIICVYSRYVHTAWFTWKLNVAINFIEQQLSSLISTIFNRNSILKVNDAKCYGDSPHLSIKLLVRICGKMDWSLITKSNMLNDSS